MSQEIYQNKGKFFYFTRYTIQLRLVYTKACMHVITQHMHKHAYM